MDDGEQRFNQLSIEGRGKFDEETVVNVNSIKRNKTGSQRPSGFSNEYIVVRTQMVPNLLCSILCACCYWGTFMVNIFLLDYIIQKDTDLIVKINSILGLVCYLLNIMACSSFACSRKKLIAYNHINLINWKGIE
jgi:hypothetical protein